MGARCRPYARRGFHPHPIPPRGQNSSVASSRAPPDPSAATKRCVIPDAGIKSTRRRAAEPRQIVARDELPHSNSTVMPWHSIMVRTNALRPKLLASPVTRFDVGQTVCFLGGTPDCMLEGLVQDHHKNSPTGAAHCAPPTPRACRYVTLTPRSNFDLCQRFR